MGISLSKLAAGNYGQTLAAVAGFLDKGAAHCTATGMDADALTDARLHDDMLPLSFQVVSIAHHSLGALQALQSGVFKPPSGPGPRDYAALQGIVAEARQSLQAIAPSDIDTCEGGDVVFDLGKHKLPFVAEDFILSFSLPNFYFHTTTAYDILRHNGVPLGKRDYLGQLKMKG